MHEPMTDLVAVLGRLVTPAGKILVPGIDENVAPLTPEEKARYEAINVTVRSRLLVLEASADGL